MASIEPVNYKYFGVSIIFLILTYYYLVNTQNIIHNNNNNNKHVIIKTKDGEIGMNPNIFEMHMQRLKNNILYIHKNFNPNKCSIIKKHLANVKIHTKRYIELNKENIDSEFCDLKSRFKLIDDNMLKEREMLKNKLSKKIELQIGRAHV